MISLPPGHHTVVLDPKGEVNLGYGIRARVVLKAPCDTCGWHDAGWLVGDGGRRCRWCNLRLVRTGWYGRSDEGEGA